MNISNPTKENIDKVLSLINQEFVLDRGKYLHIKDRFPYLFSEANFPNIFFISHDNLNIDAVMAVKTVSLNFDNQVFNLFFVGSQVIHPLMRSKGLGRYLFEYVTDHYLNKGFDLGVGWTRLQDYYIKTGWTPYENGIFVHCQKLKNSIQKDIPIPIDCIQDFDNYTVIDNYRISKCENYIVRNKTSGIEGFGTIYSPCENSFTYAAIYDNEIIGYICGATVNDKAIIYEFVLNDLAIFPELVKHLCKERNIASLFVNTVEKYPHEIDVLSFFETSIIEKPSLSIYRFNNIEVFDKIKNFYIPFTDRI